MMKQVAPFEQLQSIERLVDVGEPSSENSSIKKLSEEEKSREDPLPLPSPSPPLSGAEAILQYAKALKERNAAQRAT
jgi:hypothetical protein